MYTVVYSIRWPTLCVHVGCDDCNIIVQDVFFVQDNNWYMGLFEHRVSEQDIWPLSFRKVIYGYPEIPWLIRSWSSLNGHRWEPFKPSRPASRNHPGGSPGRGWACSTPRASIDPNSAPPRWSRTASGAARLARGDPGTNALKFMVPQKEWVIRKNPIELNDLGVPLF